MPPCTTTPDQWLRDTFAHRHWLLAELAAVVERRPPIRVPVPNPRTFGHAFETAMHYDLAIALPHVRELRAFPRTIARELAHLAGYGPPPGQAHAPWPTWRRRGDEPVPRHRLHYPAAALSFYRDVYYQVGDRTAAASRAAIGGPISRDYLLRFAAAQEPAFLAFMASYDNAIRHTLRQLGPASPAPVLPGGRTADLLVGRTLVEIKTGWLTHLDEREHVADQLLSYGLLSQLTDHPATHVAIYLARYDTMRRYHFQVLAQRSATRRIDLSDAARTYLGLLARGRRTDPGERWTGTAA